MPSVTGLNGSAAEVDSDDEAISMRLAKRALSQPETSVSEKGKQALNTGNTSGDESGSVAKGKSVGDGDGKEKVKAKQRKQKKSDELAQERDGSATSEKGTGDGAIASDTQSATPGNAPTTTKQKRTRKQPTSTDNGNSNDQGTTPTPSRRPQSKKGNKMSSLASPSSFSSSSPPPSSSDNLPSLSSQLPSPYPSLLGLPTLPGLLPPGLLPPGLDAPLPPSLVAPTTDGQPPEPEGALRSDLRLRDIIFDTTFGVPSATALRKAKERAASRNKKGSVPGTPNQGDDSVPTEIGSNGDSETAISAVNGSSSSSRSGGDNDAGNDASSVSSSSSSVDLPHRGSVKGVQVQIIGDQMVIDEDSTFIPYVFLFILSLVDYTSICLCL